MEKLLTSDAIQLFILAVFPGLISMHVYRLLMPARSVDWKTAVLEGMFYSILNFALCLPLLVPITFNNFPTDHPVWFALGFLAVLLVGPIAWPLILCKLMRNTKLMKGLQLQFPTAWDAFFDRRQECFMIIHLKNGNRIAGYFGPGSYATSFPKDGELYVRAVYTLDKNGHFSGPVPDTRGLLIRKDEYSYIELFDVPQQTEGDATNVQG